MPTVMGTTKAVPSSTVAMLGATAGATPASNTAATITLPANTTMSWVLDCIFWSFSANPAAGTTLTIAWGTNTETFYISTGGPGFLPFIKGKKFPINTSVVITLNAGGSGVQGSLPALSAYLDQPG